LRSDLLPIRFRISVSEVRAVFATLAHPPVKRSQVSALHALADLSSSPYRNVEGLHCHRINDCCRAGEIAHLIRWIRARPTSSTPEVALSHERAPGKIDETAIGSVGAVTENVVTRNRHGADQSGYSKACIPHDHVTANFMAGTAQLEGSRSDAGDSVLGELMIGA